MDYVATCPRCGAPPKKDKAGAAKPCPCAFAVPPPTDQSHLLPLPWLVGIVALLGGAGAVLVAFSTHQPPAAAEAPEPTQLHMPAANAAAAPEPSRLMARVPALEEEADETPAEEPPPPLPVLHAPAVEPGRLHMPAPVPEGPPRRNRASEQDLLRQLALAEEVALGKSGANLYESYVRHIARNGDKSGSKGVADHSVLMRLRPDLARLGLRDGPSSMLPGKAAAELGVLSRKLRAYLQATAPSWPNSTERDLVALRERMRADLRGKRPEWLRAEAVPALNQLLMAQDAPTRGLLVELLAAIPQPAATKALVQRAVYDLNPDVRDRAAEALRGRDPETWRPLLLKAFNYPWAPPADFAAEALVKLKDTGAVSELITKLRDPHPGRPSITPDRRVVIREVVKINHEHSCMICHAPAVRGDEPVIGLDPVNTRPANPFATGPGYQERKNPVTAAAATAAAAVGKQRIPNWVRADVTFLRQDFSVTFPLPLPNPPVRFDYVVRTRPLDGAEWKRWKGTPEVDNPQREAILFALRELTGQDYGSTTDRWVKAFPDAEPDARAAKLAERLVRAEPIARLGMVQVYQAGKGVEYTWALARAIPRLSGPPKETTRLALAQRLEKATTEELQKCLEDRDPEVRRAAEAARARKKDPVGD